MSESPSLSYPRVTVRFMACVYGTRAVRFGGGPCDPEHNLFVAGPEPADRSALTPDERARVLAAAARETRATGRRRCVVFGPADRVYVEPDGSLGSGPPVRGGIRA